MGVLPEYDPAQTLKDAADAAEMLLRIRVLAPDDSSPERFRHWDPQRN
jgi:hypothetical protein